MTNQYKVWAIIPAGGVGSRMSARVPKQYLRLHGRPILHHTLSRICASPVIDGVVIGISREDTWWLKGQFSHPKVLGVYEGGKERADTVLNGLHYLNSRDDVSASDWALIHDAVRPCLIQQDLQSLMTEANANKSGAVLGKKLVDTLKISDEDEMVQKTIDRKNLWRAFTPQVFRMGELTRAIENAVADEVQVTDEAMAMERLGVYPVMVEGHSTNIKVTIADDLDLMELFLMEFE